MNRQSERAAYVIFFMFLLECAVAVGTDAPGLPEQERSMRLVSYPCDVTIEELRASAGQGIVIYKWNGTDYEEAAALERGVGYFVSAASGVSPDDDVCANRDTEAPAELKLKQGWNLIGLPVNRAMSVRDALGDLAGDPDTRVFTLRGATFSLLTSADNLEPRKGYWVYAARAASIAVNNTIWSSIILSYSENSHIPYECGGGSTPIVVTGSELSLKANGYYQDEHYGRQYKDVTGTAVWSVSDTSVAEIKGGVFKGLRPGKVIVKTAMGRVTSGSQTFEVRSKDDALCLMLSTESGATNIEPETTQQLKVTAIFFSSNSLCEAEYAYYDSLCQADVTKSVSRWEISQTGAGTIDAGGIFHASDEETTTDITAFYGDAKSNKLTLNIRTRKLTNISLEYESGTYTTMPYACDASGGAPLIAPGDTLKLQAYGYYTYGDVSYYDNGGYDYGGDVYYTDSYYDDSYDGYYGYGYYSGSNEDITEQVEWEVSDERIVEVEGGTITGKRAGTATITASYGGVTSTEYRVSVVEKEKTLCVLLAPSNGLKIPPGGASKLTAAAYYLQTSDKCKAAATEDDYYYGRYCQANVTSDVSRWELTQPSAGSMDGDGNFQAGDVEMSTNVTAVYDGLKSNSVAVKVMNVYWMIVWVQGNAPSLPKCPMSATYTGCYAAKPGDTYQFAVYAQDSLNIASYQYSDVTATAEWEVSDPAVVEMGAGGVLNTKKQGLVWIRAYVGDARTDKIWVAVGEKSGFEFLVAGTTGDGGGYKPVKPLQVGNSYPVKAVHYKFSPSSGNSYCYDDDFDDWGSDVGYQEYNGCSSDYAITDVTSSATWKVADNALGEFTSSSSSYYYDDFYFYDPSSKYFKGLSPGMADVTAEYNGLTSNTITFDVWDTRTMTYCDASNVNKGEWNDDVASAMLETDCKVYDKGESVRIRYSAYLDKMWMGYIDNCLDLFILDGNNNIVRTIRNEGCTNEPLNRSTMAKNAPVYQTLAVWDMRNDAGNAVPAGQYYAVARFSVVYEPVIRLPFTIK